MTNRWLRAALVLSVLWAAILCLIAAYEALTVDPWSFIGQNRGPMFFVWSAYLVPDATPFGELALVFDALTFWLVLLLPAAFLLTAAGTVPRLIRLIRRRSLRQR